MAVNREMWLTEFKMSDLPHWPCPTCHEGWLTLVKNTYRSSESAASRKEYAQYVAVSIPWASGVFSCMLICNSSKCKESVALSGNYEVKEEWLEDELSGQMNQHYPDICTIKTFVPTVHIITVPEFVPVIITKAVIESFKTFWLDPSSCANKIRTAVEVILTDRKVKKVEETKKGRALLSLHRRIKLFAEQEPTAGQMLEAIKWIGNDGSHNSGISQEELIHAYDILSLVLNRIYETETERIEVLSKEILVKKKAQRDHNISNEELI